MSRQRRITIPCGWRTWAPPSDPSIDNPYGINIFNNELDGDAFGYGIAIANAFNITATGNVSTATHSGQGGYFNVPHLIPDPATDFAYAPLHTFNCTYGAEFHAASEQNGLDFLLYNSKHSRTETPDGYLYVAYTPEEAVATVELAYMEMLHRLPDAAELTVHTNDLISTMSRSDDLRVDLMHLPEFDAINPWFTGDTTVNGMQSYRTSMWMENLKTLDAVTYDRSGDTPEAKAFYQEALNYLTGDYLPVGMITMSSVSGGLNIEYEGALTTSTNLQSWQVVSPQPGSPVLISPDDSVRFFKAVAE